MPTRLPTGELIIDAREPMLEQLRNEIPIKKDILSRYRAAISTIEIQLPAYHKMTNKDLNYILKTYKIKADFKKFLFNFSIISRVSVSSNPNKYWWSRPMYSNEMDHIAHDLAIYNYFKYKRTGDKSCIVTDSIPFPIANIFDF